MKQTPVEWLIEQLPKYGSGAVKTFPELFEQAKEMEKNKYPKENINHLKWIYYRMIIIHNENVNYDYMIKFKNIIKQFKKK